MYVYPLAFVVAAVTTHVKPPAFVVAAVTTHEVPLTPEHDPPKLLRLPPHSLLPGRDL